MATVVPMDWSALRREFDCFRANMIPDDMRAAVNKLIDFGETVFGHNKQMSEELAMARLTLMALVLASPDGCVDVPYANVQLINDTDVLRATEEEVPNPEGGTMHVKRFRVGTTLVVAPGRVN